MRFMASTTLGLVLLLPAVLLQARPRDPLTEVLGPVVVPRWYFPPSVRDFRSQRRMTVSALKSIRPPMPVLWRALLGQNGGRSSLRPASVHRLRPGDVDVVAAMGDSISAGNGALALGLQDIMLEDRGHAFATGGSGSWRSVLTLANILREFNPRLVGPANATCLTTDKASQFNVAEPMAGTVDVAHQAKILAARMVRDERVNFKEDWKLVNLLVGPNAMCSSCFEDPDAFLRRERDSLIRGIDVLMALMPRTLLVVDIPPDVVQALALGATRGRGPAWCDPMSRFECPCVFGDRFQAEIPRMKRTFSALQQVHRQVVAMDRFRHREDFAVVSAPFLSGRDQLRPFRRGGRPNAAPDLSFFSTDCFHLSQKGHAVASNGLWNNLLEPEGAKSEWAPLFQRFLCPTSARPYLCTWRNC